MIFWPLVDSDSYRIPYWKFGNDLSNHIYQKHDRDTRTRIIKEYIGGKTKKAKKKLKHVLFSTFFDTTQLLNTYCRYKFSQNYAQLNKFRLLLLLLFYFFQFGR